MMMTMPPPLRIKRPRPLISKTCELCTHASLREACPVNGTQNVRPGRPVRARQHNWPAGGEVPCSCTLSQKGQRDQTVRVNSLCNSRISSCTPVQRRKDRTRCQTSWTPSKKLTSGAPAMLDCHVVHQEAFLLQQNGHELATLAQSWWRCVVCGAPCGEHG